MKAQLQALEPDEIEELPEASEPRALEPTQPRMLPDVRVAGAVAAGGFVVGAATIVVVGAARHRRKNGLTRSKRKKQLPSQSVFSRSFLVDIHMLNK